VTKKDLGIFIEHIIESIGLIDKYVEKISKEEFSKRKDIQDSVTRRIEIIGETVKNLHKDVIAKYSAVPWKEIIETRNKLIHHYFGVDLDTIWSIAKKDLPSLKKQILKIKADLEKGNYL